MTVPTPKQIYDDPNTYWGFVTIATDTAFEGQHFDRKEAGRIEADGTVHRTKLKNIRNQASRSAFRPLPMQAAASWCLVFQAPGRSWA